MINNCNEIMTETQIKSICKATITIALLVTPSLVFGQVNVSDRFEEVLKEIVKDETKKKIFKYTTKQDPVLGLMTRELIGQLIDANDEKAIIRIGVNAGMELMYLSYIRLKVEAIIKADPEIMKQAKKQDFDKKKLIAYSSLYYYYSERIKARLPIPPYIEEYTNIKQGLEAIVNGEGKKLTTLISRQLTIGKKDTTKFFVDMNLFVFIQNFTRELVFDKENALAGADKALNNLLKELPYTDRSKLFSMIKSAKNFEKKDSTIAMVHMLFQKVVTETFLLKAKSSQISDEKLAFIQTTLTGAIERIFITAVNPYFDQERMVANVKISLVTLLDRWLESIEKNPHGLTYHLTLSATPLFTDSTGTVDFTLMDQLRYYPFVKNSLFLFAGGFADPILKTVTKADGISIYPFGAGIDVSNKFSIAAVAGFPFQDITTLNWYYGFNLAYNIPLKYLLKK